MFKDYEATKKDFEAIEEGIKTVWHPKLNFVFKNKELIKKVIVVSYDSKNIYLWSQTKFPKLTPIKCNLKQYFAYQIPHQTPITDSDYSAWYAYVAKKEFYSFLPRFFTLKSQFTYPRISGGLLIPFIKIHQRMKKRNEYPSDPYTTRESFLATLVHEFGHIYWNHYKLWWYSNKKENLLYLREAKQLYKDKKKNSKVSLSFPVIEGLGEIFAFLSEYEASSFFLSMHKQNLDIFIKHRLEKLMHEEKKKNLGKEDSVLEPSRNPHDFSFVIGKIILSHYPKTWPQVLCSAKLLKLTL